VAPGLPGPGRPAENAGFGDEISGQNQHHRRHSVPSRPTPGFDKPIAQSRRPPAATGLSKTVNRAAREGAAHADTRVPRARFTNYLKWLCLGLFAYVGILFAVKIPWAAVLHATFLPRFPLNGPALTAVVAVLGTTISPYLFFWQASEGVWRSREKTPPRTP